MTALPRWVTDTADGHSQWYIDRFRKLAADGVDLAGEARLVDAMVAPRSRVLDAGCGPGRVGAVLHARGHHVVGVDVDAELIAAAQQDHPGPLWLVADLVFLDLPAAGVAEPFDAAVVAGNVMTFLAPGTEPDVLRRIAAHLVPDAIVVVGFGTDRGYPLRDFDTHVAEAGLTLEHRFATWDLRPWHDEATFAVSVLRLPVTDEGKGHR
ncbi:MAG TPA: class I SAM-dependent methyltransferase [Kineosporiaceae bacterium]